MKPALSPAITRYLVLAPTLALSVVLGALGVSPIARVPTCLAVGAALIVLVSRYQQKRLLG
jgi:Flp pilus assembly protein TadB